MLKCTKINCNVNFWLVKKYMLLRKMAEQLSFIQHYLDRVFPMIERLEHSA